MRSKVRLRTDAGVTHPVSAAVHLSATPWGAEIITAIRFPSVSGPATLRWPVNPNVTVLDLIVIHARRIGATTIDSVGNRFEMVTDGIHPIPGEGITVVLVTAQPMSFKRLFMEWIHLGSPEAPCLFAVSVELVDFSAELSKALRIQLSSEADSPLDIYLKDNCGMVGPVLLTDEQTPRLQLKLASWSGGFKAYTPLYVDDGQRVIVLHSGQFGGTPWYIKKKRWDSGTDNTLYATTRCGPPPRWATETSNPDLMLAVAAAILEKTSHGRNQRVAPALSVTNLSDLLAEVNKDPLCWTVAGDDVERVHPDIEHLDRIARLVAMVPIPADADGNYDEHAFGGVEHYFIGPEEDMGPLPEVVQTVLRAIGM